MVLREIMRVKIPLPMSQRLRIAVGIHQMGRDRSGAFFFDLIHRGENSEGRIGLGSRSAIKHRFRDRIISFRHSDIIKGISRRNGNLQSPGISHADIFTGKDDQPSQDKMRVLTGKKHLRHPIQRSVRVTAAYGFDKRRDRVIMGVAFFVIIQRPLLDGILSHGKRDVDLSVFIGSGTFNSKFNRVQQVSRIGITSLNQQIPGIIINDNIKIPVTALFVGKRPGHDDAK